MTRADKFEEIFGYKPATDQVLCNEHDYCGESDACNYCTCNRNNFGREEDWWNAEYKEPTTKNDLGVDAISRADVDAVIEQMRVKLKDGRMYILAEVVQDIIRELPSVTPQEPRKGHWISTETKGVRYAFWCRYKCSLCGELSAHTNFCPNCGAKMIEPQESEDKE